MQDSPQYPSLGLLQRLGSLSELSDRQLLALAERLPINSAQPGYTLVGLNSEDNATYYLLTGRVRLVAADGKQAIISDSDPSARHPLAHLRPARYEVTTIGQVTYLKVDPELIEEIKTAQPDTTIDPGYEVDEEDQIDSMPVENQLIFRLYEELNNDSLTLPSLPKVAMKIGQAIADESTDAKRLAELLSNDPAISAKLLKISNSARYAGQSQTRTLPQAISRLGFKGVHHLVICFALKELFRCESENLSSHMDALWRHSRQVAAMAHVLAQNLRGFDPDFALLAGLLHDIGALAIINYARDYPETAEDPEHLDQAIDHLRGQLGRMIIQKWHLPDELAEVADKAEDWCHDSAHTPDYINLIIVAQAHCHLSRNQMAGIPPLSEIPAFERLGFKPSAEHSLKLLKKSEKEIRHAESLLAG